MLNRYRIQSITTEDAFLVSTDKSLWFSFPPSYCETLLCEIYLARRFLVRQLNAVDAIREIFETAASQ